jgi:hypothetical protein
MEETFCWKHVGMVTGNVHIPFFALGTTKYFLTAKNLNTFYIVLVALNNFIYRYICGNIYIKIFLCVFVYICT